MMTIKTAIIGPGKIAGARGCRNTAEGKAPFTHAHAIALDDRYILTAVVGANQSETDAFADRWDIAGRYTDLRAMLATVQPDLVVITTPDGSHAETIIEALKHAASPKVIICEKPVCIDANELAQIDAVLNENPGTTLLTNQSLRLAHSFTAVRDLIASGDLGEPMMARWVYYGGWMHNGVHLVDMLPLVFGQDATLISARHGHIDREDDPCIDAIFHVGSVPIHFESTPEYAYQLSEGEVRLSRGRIRMAEFCTEVYVDEPVQNDIGEIELKLKSKVTLPMQPTPMEHLYQLCGDFLVSGDNRVISLIGMDAIRPTMQHLFKAIDLSRTTLE